MQVFEKILIRVRELADLPIGQLRSLAEEDEARPVRLDKRPRSECLSSILDREFFDAYVEATHVPRQEDINDPRQMPLRYGRRDDVGRQSGDEFFPRNSRQPSRHEQGA